MFIVPICVLIESSAIGCFLQPLTLRVQEDESLANVRVEQSDLSQCCSIHAKTASARQAWMWAQDSSVLFGSLHTRCGINPFIFPRFSFASCHTTEDSLLHHICRSGRLRASLRSHFWGHWKPKKCARKAILVGLKDWHPSHPYWGTVLRGAGWRLAHVPVGPVANASQSLSGAPEQRGSALVDEHSRKLSTQTAGRKQCLSWLRLLRIGPWVRHSFRTF